MRFGQFYGQIVWEAAHLHDCVRSVITSTFYCLSFHYCLTFAQYGTFRLRPFNEVSVRVIWCLNEESWKGRVVTDGRYRYCKGPGFHTIHYELNATQTQKYYTANPILSLLLSPLYGAKWVFCYLRGTLALPADSPCGDAYISSLLHSRHIQMAHRWVNIATVLPERCFMGENEGIMDYERVLVQGTKWWRITTKKVAQNLQVYFNCLNPKC